MDLLCQEYYGFTLGLLHTCSIETPPRLLFSDVTQIFTLWSAIHSKLIVIYEYSLVYHLCWPQTGEIAKEVVGVQIDKGEQKCLEE